MRIAYCLPQVYNPGGIERITLLKAKYLSEKGYDVHIITAEQLGKPLFFNENSSLIFHDIGVDFTSTLSLNIVKRLINRQQKLNIYKKRLSKLLFELKCDIIVSTFSHEVNILPYINDGSIKILETHFPIFHQRLMANAFNYALTTKIVYYIKDWIERECIAPKYSTMVVLTQTDKNLWKKKNSNVICIPNMLTFSSLPSTSTLMKKKVLAIGHLSKIKSFDSLIKIWSLVKKQDTEWKLSIIGYGNELSNLTYLIKNLSLNESVEILPPTSSIQEHYLNSSIYALTSKYEGFPMVLLEAMQCGLPCIAFDCPNGPRDIIDNGTNGYLIPQNDYQTYAKRLLMLMHDKDLRLSMGKTAASNIQRYSQEKIMKQWERLFNDITEKTK